jgi:hypothetical protein
MSTATFVDFSTLKQQISVSQVVQMLGLKMVTKGDQMRGACPRCQQGGDRALAVNTAKSSFYCFSDKKGGDCISLVAHIKQLSQRDAASEIATFFRFVGTPSKAADHQPPAPTTVRKSGFDAQAYLSALDPAASQLSELGISPETLKGWRAGYCKTGVLRTKLAIALCDRDGNILGFCGHALDGSTPTLTFPNGVSPKDVIFGADHIQGEEVRLLRDVLEVMQASEVGESAVCLLTENVEPVQLEMLAALLDAKSAKLFY